VNSLSDFLRQVGAGLAFFLEREAGHAVVLLILIWWGYQLMTMHVDFGQRLADQATGALLYALNVRKT
jgi:hypothetical protein